MRGNWVIGLVVVGGLLLCGLITGGAALFLYREPIAVLISDAVGGSIAEASDEDRVYGPDVWKAENEEFLAKKKVDDERVGKLTEELGLNEKYESINVLGYFRRQLYKERDPDLVEKGLKERFALIDDPFKAHQYSQICGGLGDIRYGDDPASMLEILNEWVASKPDLHWPLLARGVFYKDYAWYFRGSGYADTVSKASWEGFIENMEKAQADLEAAQQLNPRDPEPSVQLISVAGGLSLGAEKMRQYYEQALAINPVHLGARYGLLNFLQPRWGGSIEAMQALGNEAKRHVEVFPYLGFVEYEVGQMLYNNRSMSKEEWTKIHNDPKWLDVYLAQLSKNPGDLGIMDSVVFEANKVKKYEIAFEYYERIGNRYPDGGRHKSLYDYHIQRAETTAESALKLRGDEQLERAQLAYELNPGSANVNIVMGAALSRKRDPSAIEYLDRAVEISPRSVRTLSAGARVAMQVKNYERAQHFAERVLQEKHSASLGSEMNQIIETCKAQL